MRLRWIWILVAGAVAIAGLLLLRDRSEDFPRLGSAPYDRPVKQKIVREDGTSFEIEITKRYVPDEELLGEKLPEPDPRRRPPDETNESARALTAMAMQAWRSGDTQDAIAHFQAAIAADPDDPEPRTQFGRMLIFLAGFPTAREHLERAAQLRPEDPQVWLDLRTLYEKSAKLEPAWQAARRARELANGREISQDENGFWVLEGNSILP